MKRLFFVMCAFAFVAQAQVRKFHYVDGSCWVKVDIVLRKCKRIRDAAFF